LVCQQKKDGSLSHRTVLEEITATYDDLGMRCERDAFDTLFDHAPDKLQVVKKVWLSYTKYSFKGYHFEMGCWIDKHHRILQVYSNVKDASEHLNTVICFIFPPALSTVITKLSQLNVQNFEKLKYKLVLRTYIKFCFFVIRNVFWYVCTLLHCLQI
jgi:hypothetical protein